MVDDDDADDDSDEMRHQLNVSQSPPSGGGTPLTPANPPFPWCKAPPTKGQCPPAGGRILLTSETRVSLVQDTTN